MFFFSRHAVMSMFTFKRHKVFMPLCHYVVMSLCHYVTSVNQAGNEVGRNTLAALLRLRLRLRLRRIVIAIVVVSNVKMWCESKIVDVERRNRKGQKIT